MLPPRNIVLPPDATPNSLSSVTRLEQERRPRSRCPDISQALLQSSRVAAFGMLIVLEFGPEMNGRATAIIRMGLSAVI
jgi:hypothetical protein